MSRPILSRPRTRVYGCNYDKGESYYKPMVDHLDRKYSGRPLFSEPRNSFADEVAARRSDIGSRHLAGIKDETFDDDPDYFYDGYGRDNHDDDIEDEFVSIQRRFKQRAANAFEEDLAELRRKRRDLQDRLFDMIDVDAEISKAKTTLENANTAFLKHATKFDNHEEPEIEPDNLLARLEKTRRVKKIVKETGEIQQATTDEMTKSKKIPLFKWSKFAELENEMPKLVGGMTKARIRDEVEMIPEIIPVMLPQPEINKDKQLSERRRSKKRSAIKRKKSVTF